MTEQKPKKHEDYTAKNITKLTPREHVRRRPGMYIGGTHQGAFYHLLWEVIDDALTEALFDKSPCNTITIKLLSDTQISVANNGLGISADLDEFGKSHLELNMTQMYIRRSVETGQIVGGLHGLGVDVVNYLSSQASIESKHDGYLWRQTYSEGLPTSDVEQIRALNPDESTGTTITFTPDFTIMDEGLIYDYDRIVQRCRELSYLVPDTTFHIIYDEQKTTLHAPNGIIDWIKAINADATPLHPIIYTTAETSYTKHGTTINITLELALQFRQTDAIVINGYATTIHTPEGGTHIDNLYNLLQSAIYGDDAITDKPLKGLVAIVHLHHPDPQFESQTKIKLLNTDVEAVLETAVQQLVENHPEIIAQLRNHFCK